MYDDRYPTGSQALQWVLPEQQCDELLSISWRCVLSVRPVDLIWTEREAKSTHLNDTVALRMTYTEQESRMILTTDNLTEQFFRSVSEERHASYQELV